MLFRRHAFRLSSHTGHTPSMRARGSFNLSGAEVHIWTLPTRALTPGALIFESLLAADELDRAGRFRFGHQRESFVIARGALRCLLGLYLNILPKDIHFLYGAKGKPALEAGAQIEFNMTHSGSLAAVAITAGCQVGIDLEQICPLPDLQQVAAGFFHSAEASEIMSLPASERERAFFSCWTRKEAYVKAVGDGLSSPLDDFRVTVQPNTPPRFIHLGNRADGIESWTLHDLCLAPDYAAALAYRDRQRPLSIFPILDLADFFSTM